MSAVAEQVKMARLRGLPKYLKKSKLLCKAQVMAKFWETLKMQIIFLKC